MQFGIYTENGRKHSVNEDYVIADANAGIYIVCDGMGGHSAGDLASLEAANFLLNYLRQALNQVSQSALIERTILDSMMRANAHILKIAGASKALTDMGTTALIAYIQNNNVYICHVGDSRAYLVRDNGVVGLTKDHSYVQSLVDRGQISEEQANSHPKKNLILQSLGTASGVAPDITHAILASDDILLLCTDGLSNVLTEKEMHAIITTADLLEHASYSLVKKAFFNGGDDDATALLIAAKALNIDGEDKNDR